MLRPSAVAASVVLAILDGKPSAQTGPPAIGCTLSDFLRWPAPAV